MGNTSLDMVRIAYKALDDKKGEDIKIIKIDEISSIADYFIIVNGTNSSQLRALHEEVEEKMSTNGFEPRRIEGIRSDNWILMDYGDIIIHIFSKDDREFYDLERVWRDGEYIDNSDIEKICI